MSIPSTSETAALVAPDSTPQSSVGSTRRAPKGFMRLSSSLQDLSSLSKLDLEDGGGSGSGRGTRQGRPVPKAIRGLLSETAGGSSFSKEKLPMSLASRKKWFRVIGASLCFVLLIFLIYALFYYVSVYVLHKSSSYYVILDCGSTGTRVYVYESSVNQNRQSGELPLILKALPEDMDGNFTSKSGRAYKRMETEPGLAKLVRNETGLRAAMTPLIQWAEKQIPKNAYKRTSVFLYATAGVRRLPKADSEWLLSNVWSILKSSTFLCRRAWVRTISGMEEAYFGWIALNYQMGLLGSGHANETLGALDLGGSSLQVTFENEDVINDQTSLNLSIGSINHHLSAYSLAGYGLNDAFDKSVVHLLKHATESTLERLEDGRIVIKHPCLNDGYREDYHCSQCETTLDIEGSPNTEGGKSKGQKGISVKLVGSPQWDECSALAKNTVNLSEWSSLTPAIDCDIRPCALDIHLPHPHGHFYAMSGFFVVFKFFNLSSDATIDDMLQKGQEFCEKTWEIAKNSVVPQQFIEQYCFRAPYVASVLRDGLHIRDTEVVIGSGSTTWTLGVALLQAGQAYMSRIIFPSYMVLQERINPFFLIFMLLATLGLLFLAISFAGKWLRDILRRAYLPLFRQNASTNGPANNISFRFHQWSPIYSGESRAKMPLSPKVVRQEHHPFGMVRGLGGSSIQLTESSLNPSPTSVSHSYSYGNLGQIYPDNEFGSWAPYSNQRRLQNRRSQSREDLTSSLAEIHISKG